MENENFKKQVVENEHSGAKLKGVDPEESGETDPQQKMEGPVSTLAKKLSKTMETNWNQEDATKEHDERM